MYTLKEICTEGISFDHCSPNMITMFNPVLCGSLHRVWFESNVLVSYYVLYIALSTISPPVANVGNIRSCWQAVHLFHVYPVYVCTFVSLRLIPPFSFSVFGEFNGYMVYLFFKQFVHTYVYACEFLIIL